MSSAYSYHTKESHKDGQCTCGADAPNTSEHKPDCKYYKICSQWAAIKARDDHFFQWAGTGSTDSVAMDKFDQEFPEYKDIVTCGDKYLKHKSKYIED